MSKILQGNSRKTPFSSIMFSYKVHIQLKLASSLHSAVPVKATLVVVFFCRDHQKARRKSWKNAFYICLTYALHNLKLLPEFLMFISFLTVSFFKYHWQFKNANKRPPDRVFVELVQKVTSYLQLAIASVCFLEMASPLTLDMFSFLLGLTQLL